MTTSTFGDPRRRKAIDMSFWVADSNARVSKVIATDIMCVEKGINDVMVAMACAVRLEFKGNVDLQRRAVSMSDLKQVAEEVRADLKRRAQWLADLPMTRSIAFSFQWLANVVAFSAGMMGMHLATEAANLLTTAKHVDGLCPRWGDFFPERGPLQEQLAKLQLVDNKAVTAELPKAIRELDGRVRSCRALAEVCGQPPDAGPAKEAMHVARNALDWGKRTIQVAAATKILFFPAEQVAGHAQTIAQIQGSLPASLVRAIEQKGRVGTAGASTKAESTPTKPGTGLLKRARSELNARSEAASSGASASCKKKRPALKRVT